ncbi:hypothetical protein E2562_021417 [Oryza meyeriana var. granulata]|uniref:Uncharacterized protein n=1 Tax=Oryza meyeriana var. granulata TaxID=110450 RepID=A0A6G1EXN0_9ORYZ|nr:hypothetical protein E2562_021417 [Oryza meyeriana var. granulata]
MSTLEAAVLCSSTRVAPAMANSSCCVALDWCRWPASARLNCRQLSSATTWSLSRWFYRC